jgi:hypothetical protein
MDLGSPSDDLPAAGPGWPWLVAGRFQGASLLGWAQGSEWSELMCVCTACCLLQVLLPRVSAVSSPTAQAGLLGIQCILSSASREGLQSGGFCQASQQSR